LTVRAYTLREIFADPKLTAKAQKYVFDHVEKGDFKPKIDRMFPFAQIVEAHRYMESNEQIGKIVVSVP
jgi:NADPH:quinone reductase-like Zn-dependent oxidoreductase